MKYIRWALCYTALKTGSEQMDQRWTRKFENTSVIGTSRANQIRYRVLFRKIFRNFLLISENP